MTDFGTALQFFAAFSLAIEMAFETFYSLPWVDAWFKKDRQRGYLKPVLIVAFCLVLCAVLSSATGPEQGALLLERVFGKRVPVVDIVLTALVLAGGTRAFHDVLQRVNGRVAQKLIEGKS